MIEAGDPARPTIVFVHGYPDTKEIWDGVLELLAGRFHVVAYDVRGAGASSAPRGPAAYDFERLADDFAAVVAAASPTAPVHLVGHDWGGIAGWELAALPRLRDKLASFTTIAGPALPQLAEGLRDQVRHGRLLAAAGRVRRSWYVLALCTPGVPTLAWRGVLGREWWRRYLRYVERVPVDTAHPSPSLTEDGVHGSNLYRRNILWRKPGRTAPASVSVPVQLIVPSGDRFISPSYYDGAERHAPRLRRRIVPGSHWAPRSQPALLARWILEFVEDVERGSAPRLRPRGGGAVGAEQLAGRLAAASRAPAAASAGRRRVALAAHGARMLLVDRDRARGSHATAASISGSHTFICDVADPEAMERLANRGPWRARRPGCRRQQRRDRGGRSVPGDGLRGLAARARCQRDGRRSRLPAVRQGDGGAWRRGPHRQHVLGGRVRTDKGTAGVRRVQGGGVDAERVPAGRAGAATASA